MVIFLNCNITAKKEDSVFKTLEPLFLFGILSYNSTSPFDRFAVRDLEFSRFLGRWNEIKRIDNSFQLGLRNVNATYASLSDGNISVINSGTALNGTLSNISGIALIPNSQVGILKVSFFFPFFFGDFIILDIDKTSYQTAMIGGPSSNILWIFSRTNSIDPQVESGYIAKAKSYGYNTDSLQKFRD